ncbi:MAG: sigma-70 family RNA polymerase sigma factor [bacterium]|jgi:RNA polymerase sigma-70 factor (ECF subfamily)|nr:sigma-70 family RNA polymerase sigma factor [candidate division KSB1 bacterium]MDH7560364.1 sigma-70 family RNA polymerase sigma factor [bacterium]
MEVATDTALSESRRLEHEAVVRCQRGDARAFKVLVERYQRLAYSVALGLVRCHDDALDLSQEAFIRAYQHIGLFDPERPFLPWFYQLLRNLCFNHLRARRAQRLQALEEAENDAVDLPIEQDYDPEVIVERNETAQRVWRAIGRLPDKYREIIVLRHFQQLSYAEMAALLFLPLGTVMSRCYHARRALRALLEREQGGDLHEV